MTSQVFYRKWRPQTLGEVVGQEPVTRTLLNALKSSRIAHAYLFCGPRGTGKTSTGRILAKAVNCLSSGKGEPCNSCELCRAITEGRSLDVIEIDAASNRGIDEIRNLREKVNYAPHQGRYKVYIIDEVHMLTKEASNALLKTLEEPPPHAIFILATTEAHKVLPTILSRCQRFDFRRLSQSAVISKLARVCEAEEIKADTEGLRLIARAVTGSLRDAENLLQQMATYYGEIGLSQVQALLGISGDWRARELVKNIVDKDTAAGIATISSVSSDGLDLRQFNREVMEYLRELLLVKTGSGQLLDVTSEEIAELEVLASRISLSQVLKAIKTFGQLELGLDNYATLPLELALVDSTTLIEKENTVPHPVMPAPAVTRTPVPAPGLKPVKPEPAPDSESAPVPAPEPVKAGPAPELAQELKPKSVKPDSVPVAAPVKEMASSVPETAVTKPRLSSEIEHLRSNWKQAIEQAPEEVRKTPAIAILRSAGVRPVALENGFVVLAFRYKLHKEKMEKRENQSVAEKVISKFLGRPCKVQCVFEADNNHLVRAALNMGAQIIDEEDK